MTQPVNRSVLSHNVVQLAAFFGADVMRDLFSEFTPHFATSEDTRATKFTDIKTGDLEALDARVTVLMRHRDQLVANWNTSEASEEQRNEVHTKVKLSALCKRLARTRGVDELAGIYTEFNVDLTSSRSIAEQLYAQAPDVIAEIEERLAPPANDLPGEKKYVRPSANWSELLTSAEGIAKVASFGGELQAACFGLARQSGWWTDLATGESTVSVHHEDGRVEHKVNVPEKLCLIHSEVSEGMEGYRKNLPDDKLPHRTMLEVELADAVIRCFDLAGGLGLDLGGAIAEKLAFNANRADHKIENRVKENGKKF